MAFVITQACIGTKDASCVAVCPVDCIHDGGEQYYIDPEVCIDCGACLPTCPVQAIYAESDVPPNLTAFIAKNAAMAKRGPASSGGDSSASATPVPPSPSAPSPPTPPTPAPGPQVASTTGPAPSVAPAPAPTPSSPPPPSVAASGAQTESAPARPSASAPAIATPRSAVTPPQNPPAARVPPVPAPSAKQVATRPPPVLEDASPPPTPARATADNPLVEAVTRHLAEFFARALRDAVTQAVKETSAQGATPGSPVYLVPRNGDAKAQEKPKPP